QAPDVEEAHAALQRRRARDLEAAEAVEQRPQHEGQPAMQQVDRRQAEEIELRADPPGCGCHGAHAGSASGGASDRPTARYSNPAAFISAGSKRLRPSRITGSFSVARSACRSGLRNDFHSVTMTSASAPC